MPRVWEAGVRRSICSTSYMDQLEGHPKTIASVNAAFNRLTNWEERLEEMEGTLSDLERVLTTFIVVTIKSVAYVMYIEKMGDHHVHEKIMCDQIW
jgi:hypothetical protein